MSRVSFYLSLGTYRYHATWYVSLSIRTYQVDITDLFGSVVKFIHTASRAKAIHCGYRSSPFVKQRCRMTRAVDETAD